jgi:hypothetical protein
MDGHNDVLPKAKRWIRRIHGVQELIAKDVKKGLD